MAKPTGAQNKVRTHGGEAAKRARQRAQAKATPAYAITQTMREQVSLMASAGIPQRDIARVIVPGGGMHPETLRKHFREELDTALIKATANMAGALYRGAMGGNTVQQIFWLKARAGWKETSTQEHVGKDGGSIQTEDVSKKPSEIVREKIAAMVKALNS